MRQTVVGCVVVVMVGLAGCGRSREPAPAAPATSAPPPSAIQPARQEPPPPTSPTISTTVTSPRGRGLTTLPQELIDAALEGREELLDRVLREGLVDPNATSPEGRTLLMLAAFNGHASLCRRLIGYGANPRLKDATGRTALMYAASGPHVDAVRVLLDAGSEIDAVDGGERWTALMFAAAEGQLEVVRLLLERGANPDLRDADNDRAEDFAVRNGHHEVARILREASRSRAAQ